MEILMKIIPLFVIFELTLFAGELEHANTDFWKDGTFHQESVDLSRYDKGIIRAEVDGEWQEFKSVELPEDFLEWNFGARIKILKDIKKGEMPTTMAGPHNAAIATYGIKRNDTEYRINNAVKGTGFIPKRDRIKDVIKHLKETIDNSMLEKVDILLNYYKQAEKTFDITKQVSLELYSTPEFETGSFLNEMKNPGVSIVYIDIPSYELKAVAQLLHPEDPKLTDYEKDVVEYINLIHSYFHGKFKKKFIAVIYHITEVFDNSPKKGGMGVRVMPVPSP